MKVNLTYQVEFEEVPEEVNRFVTKASSKANDLRIKLSELKYVSGRGYEFVNILSEARDILRLIDDELDSASTITIGFEKAVLEQATQQQDNPEVDPADDPEVSAEANEHEQS
jgi:hypothetical protein